MNQPKIASIEHHFIIACGLEYHLPHDWLSRTVQTRGWSDVLTFVLFESESFLYYFFLSWLVPNFYALSARMLPKELHKISLRPWVYLASNRSMALPPWEEKGQGGIAVGWGEEIHVHWFNESHSSLQKGWVELKAMTAFFDRKNAI